MAQMQNLARDCSGGPSSPACPTTQSSTNYIFVSSKANDGIKTGSDVGHDYTHTNSNGETNPWWSVQFASPASVHNIAVYNRAYPYEERLANFTIYVGNSSQWQSNTLCGGPWPYPGSPSFASPAKVQCKATPLVGNYLHVVLLGPNRILSLAEVEVFGSYYVVGVFPSLDP